MKINNDRSYRRGFRIAIPLVLSVLAYDLMKSTLAGSLRESSLTLKILGVLKTQMVSFLHFCFQHPVATVRLRLGRMGCLFVPFDWGDGSSPHNERTFLCGIGDQ